MINFRDKVWWQGSKSYDFWALLTPANQRALELLESGDIRGAYGASEKERLRLGALERNRGIIQDQVNRMANGGLSEMILCLDENGDTDGGWPFHVFNPTPPCVVRYLEHHEPGFNPWTEKGIADCPHTPNCTRREK